MKKRFGCLLVLMAVFIGELLFFPAGQAEAVVLERNELLLCQGQSYQFVHGAQYSYTVDDASVVTVSEQGVVTAGVPGSTVIEVIDGSGGRAECQVTVLSGTGPNSLMIETDNMVLKPGEERYLYTQVIPDNAQNNRITFESSDPGVASVNNLGLITAHREGVTTVTARGQSSLAEKSCVVTVSAGGVQAVYASGTGKLLDEDGLPAGGVPVILQGEQNYSLTTETDGSFSLADAQVPVGAYVFVVEWNSRRYTGKVVFQARGETSFTAKLSGNTIQIDYHEVQETVGATADPQENSTSREMTGLVLPVENIMIDPDETYQLLPSALPEGTALPAVLYQSSDEQVASVRPNGAVLGVNGGTATITVTTGDGRFTAACTVKVSERESNEYSWLIIAAEGAVLAAVLILFTVVYRHFIKQKIKWELRQFKSDSVNKNPKD